MWCISIKVKPVSIGRRIYIINVVYIYIINYICVCDVLIIYAHMLICIIEKVVSPNQLDREKIDPKM